MQAKQYILILNKDFEGALLPFPQALELPASKTVGDHTFIKTDRTKTQDGYTATIYTQQGQIIDLSEYADPIITPEVAEEAQVQSENAPDQERMKTTDSSHFEGASVSSAIDRSKLPVTTIYGTSDDLIEFEGAFSGEVGAYGTDDEDKGVLIVISDGTLLEVKYGKGGQGIWGITVLKKGAAYDSFEPCDDEEADIYSDVVTLRGEVKFAYASRDWEKVA